MKPPLDLQVLNNHERCREYLLYVNRLNKESDGAIVCLSGSLELLKCE